MFRKRERFDRTDVPQEGRFTWLWGIIGIVVAFGLAYLAVRIATTRVDLEERLEDDALVSAVGSQSSAADVDGYVSTTDEVTTVLLLVVSSLDDEEECTLESATVLVIDATAGTAVKASLPLDVKVTYADEDHTLGGTCSLGGYAACVVPASDASGVSFDYVIVSTEDVLEELAGIAGASEEFDFVTAAYGLLELIVTNADEDGLAAVADALAAVGTSSVTTVEVEVTAETTTDADGNVTETGYSTISTTSLRVSLGLLVADETAEDATETAEDASEESTE